MKTLIFLTSLILSTASFTGLGHGHSHGHTQISKKKTEKMGRYHVERLIKSEKLDASWKTAIFDKSETKSFKGETKWVVIFNNEKSVKGKKLYIFLKLSGEFVAANFTGK
jgi:hypothetical protein